MTALNLNEELIRNESVQKLFISIRSGNFVFLINSMFIFA